MQVQVCRPTFKGNPTREQSDCCKRSGGPEDSGLFSGALNAPLNKKLSRSVAELSCNRHGLPVGFSEVLCLYCTVEPNVSFSWC
jgi:hypothetical protein